METRDNEPVNVKPLLEGILGPVDIAANVSDRVQPTVSIGSLAAEDSSRVAGDIKSKVSDDSDKVKSWKLPDIIESAQLKALRLPDPLMTNRVVRLIYTKSGLALLALASNDVHKLWIWQRTKRNLSGKASASSVPRLWQPSNGADLLSNDTADSESAEESASGIALSKNDAYFLSACGGKVSLFNIMTFEAMATFMPPPPAATYLAFHPQNDHIIAVGMEDSTVQIYDLGIDKVKTKLKGHQKRITGLAFSRTLNALVSSGADARLCMWDTDGWKIRKARAIQVLPGHQPSPPAGETEVQFHNDQSHLLVVHESQIAIYDSNLGCLGSWSPRDSLPAAISSGTYSCDGRLVYAGFCDGAIGVFDADSLRLRRRIAPSAYLPSSISSSGTGSAFPVVIAAHPFEPNQFALGMSEGAVHVIEPSDRFGPRVGWGSPSSKTEL